MKTNHLSMHRLAQGGLIAAMYAALTLVLANASFGPVQLRLSEALTILPVFTFSAVPGLTVGCMLANAIGLLMGANTAGAWDILIGSAATLLAALSTYALRGVRFGKLPILATLPPVVFNMVIIGLELAYVLLGGITWEGFWLMALDVGAGQLLPCIAGGLILYTALEKSGAAKHMLA